MAIGCGTMEGNSKQPRNVFVTGPPRCGKSTLIERVAREIRRPMTGFLTREIRERGKRVGFSINRLDGKIGMLAHENIKGGFRVGKYGVNIDDIEKIAVPSMLPSRPDQLVVIDEVGKMECFSPLFRETLIRTLDARNPVLGSIALKGDAFIRGIKKRTDVLLLSISEKNRDGMVDQILTILLSPRPDGHGAGCLVE